MITPHRVILLVPLIILVSGCVKYAGVPQEVVFQSSDGVELAGSLVLPHGAAAKVPGVILLHGAERATRSFVYRMHANIILKRGMAVLLYDKRGAGKSGGNFESTTYSRLIDDALAAINLLRLRSDIDSTSIGLVGASESGWLTPEVAERSGEIAFVINKVGPCLSWIETNAWETYNDLLREGISPTLAREQTNVFRRIWAYHVSPSATEEKLLKKTLERWAGKPESRLPVELRPVSTSYIQDISYDPSPFLERLTTPTLYIYGSEDINVPTIQCVERLTELRNAGKPVSFHVFDGEGHELGSVGLLGYRFSKGYSELLGDFAEKHAK